MLFSLQKKAATKRADKLNPFELEVDSDPNKAIFYCGDVPW